MRVLNRTATLLGTACLLGFTVCGGCGQPSAPNPITATDPAGLGSPQQRLQMLEQNNTMDPRLKAKKEKILQDEISGTQSAGPGHHQ